MNLTRCSEKFASLPNFWGSEARNDTGLPGTQLVITRDGCQALCGHGADTYDWMSIANSITTWVFPIIGILLQAPFESNHARGTVFSLLRWLGSPISALSYIFWNIKVSGRAALVVDMAVPYDEYPGEDGEFAGIRDSFYILTVMNQYTINRKMRIPTDGPDVAEKLLRAALFDVELVVEGDKLPELRRRTAKHLRQSRKQGVVAVFISMGWFLFSLAISIQAVFANIGPIQEADNLGLGLMLSWIPVLILSSIVDRNPANSSSVEDSLNHLVGGVWKELVKNSDLLQKKRLGSFSAPPQTPDALQKRRGSMVAPSATTSRDWIAALTGEAFADEFFVGFGGQGRRRWHYGVANAVLAGLEDEFIKEHGRNWLQLADVRDKLVKPCKSPGIYFFDLRELWHVASSGLVVSGTMFGAFILNYFTPPIGIGCRSGGYAVFCCLVTLNFVVEMAVWWLTSNHTSDEFAAQEKWERWFFIPMEIISFCWLLYMIIAQSTGLYQTCWCLGWEGWFMFATVRSWTGSAVKRHWIAALCLTLIIMMVSFVFIIAEWCTQSHMATNDYGQAMKGLERTRTFKWLTSPIRFVMDFVISMFKVFLGRKRRSLVWKKANGKATNIGVTVGLRPRDSSERSENSPERPVTQEQRVRTDGIRSKGGNGADCGR